MNHAIIDRIKQCYADEIVNALARATVNAFLMFYILLVIIDNGYIHMYT